MCFYYYQFLNGNRASDVYGPTDGRTGPTIGTSIKNPKIPSYTVNGITIRVREQWLIYRDGWRVVGGDNIPRGSYTSSPWFNIYIFNIYIKERKKKKVTLLNYKRLSLNTVRTIVVQWIVLIVSIILWYNYVDPQLSQVSFSSCVCPLSRVIDITWHYRRKILHFVLNELKNIKMI